MTQIQFQLENEVILSISSTRLDNGNMKVILTVQGSQGKSCTLCEVRTDGGKTPKVIQFLEKVKLDNCKEIKINGLFIEAGQVPTTALVAKLGIKLD